MSMHQLTTKGVEPHDRAWFEVMKRAWMKPRIKRQAGTWVCVGRGTTATGLTPKAAYSLWTLAQEAAIYATQAQAYASGKALEGRQC